VFVTSAPNARGRQSNSNGVVAAGSFSASRTKSPTAFWHFELRDEYLGFVAASRWYTYDDSRGEPPIEPFLGLMDSLYSSIGSWEPIASLVVLFKLDSFANGDILTHPTMLKLFAHWRDFSYGY
jgi:hypothetical protein